jgi:hypothetical protein
MFRHEIHNKFKSIEITLSIFSDYNNIKLEINNITIHGISTELDIPCYLMCGS